MAKERKLIWDSDIWQRMVEINGHKCYCCKEFKPLTIDHIVPISIEWNWDIMNLQPLCERCNVIKSNKVIDYRPNYIMVQLGLVERQIK